tara:strand:- start:84 stop:446 length:363 start_codon:yes stop_codon:yes gene_type:complete
MVNKEPRDKHEKFIQLAEKRTTKIIQTLESLGKLSDTRNYEFSKDETNKIFLAIKKTLRDTEEKFKQSNVDKYAFSFDSPDGLKNVVEEIGRQELELLNKLNQDPEILEKLKERLSNLNL